DPASPPLFSPHLRSLIEAGMANPEDNRWLAVLDEEWGLNGRLALHLPCKSGAPAAPSPVLAVPERAACPAEEKLSPPIGEVDTSAAIRPAASGHRREAG